MLINITGGNDLTLFEVDQSVNKIRAEVDPEAELIFGAIKDENMTGKIRVSIVATSLDGDKTENRTVLNMFSRVQNRNSGYSENLFSQNTRIENNTLGSIDGATALKLDESYELDEEQLNSVNDVQKKLDVENAVRNSEKIEQDFANIPSGVSIESASYIEKNKINETESIQTNYSNEDIEENVPKLFSEDQSHQTKDTLEVDEQEKKESDQLFDQDLNEDEEFEIPAFLRKQKF